MEIRIGLIKNGDCYPVARPSPLGNPYVLWEESQRDRVCDLYASWLRRQVAEGNIAVLTALEEVLDLANRPEGVTLGCYCYPKRCHASEIKKFLEEPIDVID